ncbi:hypothetical protein PIB30_009379 [Stylosanthes scabra]|uniref:Uncharacterized protein n=1 Tax=Stylosanthes scabra TaxID=79078 RepID=A0ABU6V5H1_9FABA|nr:hypothetical protein [Stylosanthes scabra]
MDSEEEEEYARQEDIPGSSGHGGQAQPEQGQAEPEHPEPKPTGAQEDQGQHERLDNDFATSLGSGSMLHLGMLIPILDSSPLYRVPRSRPLLRDTRGLGCPIRPPLQSTAPDMSWIPPLSPTSGGHVGGFSGLPEQQFGTPPSWEYPPVQPGSGSSSTHPVHDQQPPMAPSQQQVIRPRPCRHIQPRLCGTASHLQYPPPR